MCIRDRPCFGVQERQYLSERLTAGNSAALQTGGEEIRLLFDFGTELVGFLCLDITAEAGAVFDFHNFEFIQPDGRKNFAEGMNTTCRYTAKAGQMCIRDRYMIQQLLSSVDSMLGGSSSTGLILSLIHI